MAWLILHRATHGTPRFAVNSANILRIHDLSHGVQIDLISAGADDPVQLYVTEPFDVIMAQLDATRKEA